MTDINKLISSGFGSGYASKAPGTVGTIFFTLLWIALFSVLEKFNFNNLSLINFYILIFCTFVGTYSCKKALKTETDKDPKWVVIDEWLGMSLALQSQFIFSDYIDFYSLTFAFVLFRILDISKPFPIRNLEKLPNEIGVMADDAGCGIIVLVILLMFQII